MSPNWAALRVRYSVVPPRLADEVFPILESDCLLQLATMVTQSACAPISPTPALAIRVSRPRSLSPPPARLGAGFTLTRPAPRGRCQLRSASRHRTSFASRSRRSQLARVAQSASSAAPTPALSSLRRSCLFSPHCLMIRSAPNQPPAPLEKLRPPKFADNSASGRTTGRAPFSRRLTARLSRLPPATRVSAKRKGLKVKLRLRLEERRRPHARGPLGPTPCDARGPACRKPRMPPRVVAAPSRSLRPELLIVPYSTISSRPSLSKLASTLNPSSQPTLTTPPNSHYFPPPNGTPSSRAAAHEHSKKSDAR